MTFSHDGAAGAERRAYIEAMLADYPHLSAERLDELLNWYRTEATALDVAMVASNEGIAAPYARFRADHIDPLKGRDILRGILFASVAALLIALLIWRAM